MTKVRISEDCGNSPKNIFVQELSIAFAKGDLKAILNRLTEDVHWNILGETEITGKEEVGRSVKAVSKVAEITVNHVATHGKTGAVDGMLKFSNGKVVAFCDVYEFGNAKGDTVKEIASYRVEIK